MLTSAHTFTTFRLHSCLFYHSSSTLFVPHPSDVLSCHYHLFDPPSLTLSVYVQTTPKLFCHSLSVCPVYLFPPLPRSVLLSYTLLHKCFIYIYILPSFPLSTCFTFYHASTINHHHLQNICYVKKILAILY